MFAIELLPVLRDLHASCGCGCGAKQLVLDIGSPVGFERM
jgi:hypothetical protein